MTVMLCLSGSLGLLNRRLLDAGFLYCILSVSSLDPKLHWGIRGPPRSGVAFPTTLLSNLLELELGLPPGLELN